MSRFLSENYKDLVAYVPGEQPADLSRYVKLNTNENPFPPSEKALAYMAENTRPAHLYSDPDCRKLTALLAKTYEVGPENVICGNGSDEILFFAFSAFCSSSVPAVCPDISYGFYPVFAQMARVPYVSIPLDDELKIRLSDYNVKGTIFIANPNAPTGNTLKPSEIEELVKADSGRVVVIDEAYVDFGAESCVPLTKKYDNLLVVQTFSKSRSMAGARLGYAIGSREVIGDLQTLKYSLNPYNVNSMTATLGEGTLLDAEYTARNCRIVAENRAFAEAELKKLGFTMTDSLANFVFAKHPEFSGREIYEKLKEKDVLVRHFTLERIKDYNRITIGSRKQIEALISALKEIIEA